MTDEPIVSSDDRKTSPVLRMITGVDAFTCEGDACALPAVPEPD